jgi:hypothetical protein
MTNPTLRRPVWLTPAQRHELLEGVMAAMRHNDVDVQLCHTMVSELLEAAEREPNVARFIATFAAGLKLPDGTIPVFVCDRDIDYIASFGGLDVKFVAMLKHEAIRQ